MAAWEKAVGDHYRAVWLQEGEVCPSIGGPIHELPSDFRVLRFAPNAARSGWIYATVGMSQPDDPDALELHVVSERPSMDIVEVLYVTAHFHRTGEALGCSHTVNFGRPWMAGSRCSYGLLSLPYLDGPALENATILGQPVRCLWLIPITAAERVFKKRYGADALEDLFEAKDFEYANPLRESTC